MWCFLWWVWLAPDHSLATHCRLGVTLFDETTGLWMYSLSGMFKIYLRGWFFVDAVRCLVLEACRAPPLHQCHLYMLFGLASPVVIYRSR